MTEFYGDIDATIANESALLQFIALPGPTPAAVLEAWLRDAIQDASIHQAKNWGIEVAFPPKASHAFQPPTFPEPLAVLGARFDSKHRNDAKGCSESASEKVRNAFIQAYPHDGLVAVRRFFWEMPLSNPGAFVEVCFAVAGPFGGDASAWVRTDFGAFDLPGNLGLRQEWTRSWANTETLAALVQDCCQGALSAAWQQRLALARARALEGAWEPSTKRPPGVRF